MLSNIMFYKKYIIRIQDFNNKINVNLSALLCWKKSLILKLEIVFFCECKTKYVQKLNHSCCFAKPIKL